jgi:hypothetical protein
LKEEEKFKYDYCLPYTYKKEQETDLQQNTEIMVQVVVNGRGLNLDFVSFLCFLIFQGLFNGRP